MLIIILQLRFTQIKALLQDSFGDESQTNSPGRFTTTQLPPLSSGLCDPLIYRSIVMKHYIPRGENLYSMAWVSLNCLPTILRQMKV